MADARWTNVLEKYEGIDAFRSGNHFGSEVLQQSSWGPKTNRSIIRKVVLELGIVTVIGFFLIQAVV